MSLEGQSVVYEMSLKDMLSPKLAEAEGHASKFEGALHRIKHVAENTLESIGIGFAVFKGFEFIKESKEQWEELERAQSQIEAGLESTHHAAGLTFGELKKGAQDAAHEFKFTQAQVMDMQAQLLTFPAVTKNTFGEAQQAVLDMATRLKTDASDAAKQLGKALQDPIQGLSALHRVGVNTDELKKKFETVTSTLERQKLIIHELGTEFGGSAKMAAEADVSFRWEKSLEELRYTVGELADKLTAYLAPALEWFVKLVKDSIAWGQKHKDVLQAVAAGIGTVVAALLLWKTYTLSMIAVQKVQAAWNAIQYASITVLGDGMLTANGLTVLFTGSFAMLNNVIRANPIGALITVLGVVITVVVYCWQHFAKFRAVLYGVWGVIKEFASTVGSIFKGLWDIISGVFTISPGKVMKGWDEMTDAMHGVAERMGKSYKAGFDEGMADFNKDHELNDPKTIVEKKGPPVKPTTTTDNGTTKEKALKGSGGNKDIRINIRIGSLVDKFTVQTTNMKEGASKVKDHIVAALTSAVNDSQVIAGS